MQEVYRHTESKAIKEHHLSTQSKDCCISEAEYSDTSLQDGDSDILELHEILKSFIWNFNWLRKMESEIVNISPSLNHIIEGMEIGIFS